MLERLNFLLEMQPVTVNYCTLPSATTAILYGSLTLYAAYSDIFR